MARIGWITIEGIKLKSEPDAIRERELVTVFHLRILWFGQIDCVQAAYARMTSGRHAKETKDRKAASLKKPLIGCAIALALMLLALGLHEAPNWHQPTGASEEIPRWAANLWVTATALLGAFAAGFWIMRRSPSLPTSTVSEDHVTARQFGEERILLAVQWFIAMRWLAVLAAGIMIFVGVYVYRLLPSQVILPLTLTVGFLAICNIGYTLLIGRMAKIRRLLTLQTYLDLLVLAVLLHFSGGIENPLSILMLFHVLIGGILLPRHECFRVAATGTCLFAVIGASEALGWLPHFTLALFPHFGQDYIHASHNLPFVALTVGLHGSVLFLAAYFVTNLSENLRQNEGRLAAIAEEATGDRRLLIQALETTSTGLRVLGPDLIPFWSNRRWDEWFGSRRHVCSIFPEGADDLCPALLCLEDGLRHHHDIEEPNAPHRTFRITTAPLNDSNGRIHRIVQLAQDVTHQKEAEVKMMRAGQMAAVGELAGQIAHEINNPVGIISAKANLLLDHRRHEMPEKVAEEVEKIRNLSDRIGRIAQGLLSYCRPSSGLRTRQDLRIAIRTSLAFVRQQGIERGIEYVDHLGDRPLYAQINSAEMEQVFLNLFLNAIQAMPEGGRLTVGRAPEDGREPEERIGIRVEDTGPGIPPELEERIFQPFFTTKVNEKGTGLGLSICQGLVQNHGGEIQIDRPPQQGACFIIWLPTNLASKNESSVAK